jgi:hypothetical protein
VPSQFLLRGGEAGEVLLLDQLAQLRVTSLLWNGTMFAADELGCVCQPSQPFWGATLLLRRHAPGNVTVVVVADWNDGPPELGDLVVVQADVVAGNRAARVAHQNDLGGITAPLSADRGHGLFGVSDSGVHIAPPPIHVLLPVGAHER